MTEIYFKNRVLFLVFLILLGFSNCNLDDPFMDIPSDSVITVSPQYEKILADGVSSSVITATLGELVKDSVQSIKFYTEQGKFSGNTESNEMEFEDNTSNMKASAILISNTQVSENIQLTAELLTTDPENSFKNYTYINFTRAYADNIIVTADKLRIDSVDINDKINLVVKLYRQEGKPSMNALVEFKLNPNDQVKLDIVPFTYSADGINANAEVKRKNYETGYATITVSTPIDENGNSVSQEVTIEIRPPAE